MPFYHYTSIHLFKTYTQSSALFVKSNLNTSIIVNRRTMKSMSDIATSATLSKAHHGERLVAVATKCIDILFGKPLENPLDIMKRTVEFNAIPGENILKQTMGKGLFPKKSLPKEQALRLIQENASKFNLEKLRFIAPNERSDVRFILEAMTASRFSETSELITEVTMNSEKPTADGSKNPDLLIKLGENTFLMDIKSGDNMQRVFQGYVGQIPYTEDGKPYTVLNKEFPLEEVQKQRLAHLVTMRNNSMNYLYNKIQAINNESLITIVEKNRLIQEVLLQYLAKDPLSTLKPSLYHSIIVPNPQALNERYVQRILDIIDKDKAFLRNKDSFQRFLAKVIRIYGEEVDREIIHNISMSKDFWLGSGFERIADDIFK
jgi:hypothetical protein